MSTHVTFDPFSRAYFDDPREMYDHLLEHEPVTWNDEHGFWAITRWDDVADASKDWATFSSTYGVTVDQIVTHRPTGFESLIMIDPPRHDRLRSLVSRVFTPRAVQSLEPMVRDVITGAFDELGDRTEFDVVQDVSGPFPVEIIARMLGVPAPDRQQIRHWLDISLTRQEGVHEAGQEAKDAMLAFATYCFELCVSKRERLAAGGTAGDMLDGLIEAEYRDDEGTVHHLDDAEIAGFATLLGGAGAETVTKLVGNAAVLFSRHPDQWQLVLDDRAAIPAAVEEVLRYHPPSQYQGRYSMQDWTRHGVTIPAGSPVLLVTGAATRDPRAYEDPDRFDITREQGQNIGFGYGIHSCLGAALARMESRIALELMRERMPRFELDRDGLRRVNMTNVAGFSIVPVEIG
jgi:cytochrome P450